MTGSIIRQYLFMISKIYVYKNNAFTSIPRHKAACNIVHKYSEEIIRQRKEVLKQQSAGDSTHGKKYLDFLDILLRAKVRTLWKHV